MQFTKKNLENNIGGKMVVLHIAAISNNMCNGVCVVVPQHIIAQSKIATVGLINISNEKIDSLDDSIQINYEKKFDINNLPEPFNKPDVVVFHECYRIDYIKISRNLRKNNIPYIIVPHGSLRKEAQQKKKLKKMLANILLFNVFINNCCGLQCLSKQEFDNTKFVFNKKFIATNGILLPSIQKENFNDDVVKIIYIGRLEVHVKGLDLMIDAITQIADFLRKNRCIVDIYGPDYLGRYQEVSNLVINNDISDIVKLHHEITGEEKEENLLASDIFIQTSRHEGMPLGILEALGYGIPCLITEGTNLGNDVVSYEAGWCAENNSESIASSLEKAVNSKENWKKMSHNAVQLIKEKYSWDPIVIETIEQYKHMINFKKK